MKLAEAVLEKERLEEKLNLLKRRVSVYLKEGRPTTHLQEELQRTVNQLRDMTISIQWTEQNTGLSGIPIGAYRIRIDYLKCLASIFESLNMEKADEIWESVYHDMKIVTAATWLIDLKIPGAGENKEGT